MSRISANSFLVDENQRIQMSLSNISPDISGLTVAQSNAALLNMTEVNSSTIASDTTSMDGKMFSGADSTLASVQQNGIYGYNGSSWKQVALTSGGNMKVSLEELNGTATGQELMASSIPVVIASDQSAINVSPSEGDVDLVKVGGTAIAIGQAASGASLPVVLASDQSRIDTNANLQIADADVSSTNRVPTDSRHDVQGSQGNLSNAQSVVLNDTSSAVNVEEGANYTIFGSSTDTVNNVDIEVSVDNSNYYPSGISIFPDGSGNLFSVLQNTPVKYIRLKYNGTATVTAQVTWA